MEELFRYENAISSVPAELAALTGLRYLNLDDNQLTAVPTEFRTWGPFYCTLSGNPGFSWKTNSAARTVAGDQGRGGGGKVWNPLQHG